MSHAPRAGLLSLGLAVRSKKTSAIPSRSPSRRVRAHAPSAVTAEMSSANLTDRRAATCGKRSFFANCLKIHISPPWRLRPRSPSDPQSSACSLLLSTPSCSRVIRSSRALYDLGDVSSQRAAISLRYELARLGVCRRRARRVSTSGFIRAAAELMMRSRSFRVLLLLLRAH